MDITNSVNWTINTIISIFSYCYNTLDSITFYNISLLQFIITILILSACLPLLFTLVNSEANYQKREYRKIKSKSESR